MRIRYVLLPLVFLFVSCSEATKERFDLVVQNGNVIDLETGAIHEQTIFISNGRIKKMMTSDGNIPFEATKTIDASGKYILPGFWDNHVHFRGGDSLIKANKNFLNLFIANGITTVRDAGGDLTTSVMKWKTEIAEGNLIGPTIFTSGPKIDGPGATWAGSLEVETEADIQKALDSLERIPTDFVKFYDSSISGELYLKTIAEAEKRNRITSGHMPFTVRLAETVDSGIDAIEHLYYVMKGCASNEKEVTQQLRDDEIGFWDAMPLLMAGYQDTTAQKTFSHLKENDVYVVPTLHIGKTLSYLDEVDHSKDAYLKYMSDGIIRTYEGRVNRVKNSSEKAIADRKALDAFFGELTKKLDDAGVGLLAGSDSGAYNSYTYPGISLHQELQEMVANGLSPLDALRTSAYNGARFLKQDQDHGTIAEGKIADLVLLDANPLDNIEHTKAIFGVITKGKTYSKEQLNELLETADHSPDSPSKGES
ncbi:amidohydrolase family protein [Aggregatimonas sangjinii]|uniref:Amidohydrolase family protein n=1 Tax=Aggregatimonas sangjinii TaxID=2583587 RepID=A0A5B7STN6_9FLAO|nr:amidohydrolase family protein [Aggregatimonas sangjinii]QCX00413.1 amidohydrolase family protein [Aggregatimonas sangjinii]